MSKLRVGQIITTKRKTDNEITTDEVYQIEKFYPAFIQCRHVKGGYTETFSPFELFKNKIIDWRQVLDYMQGELCKVCEV